MVAIKVKRVGDVLVPLPRRATFESAGFDVHAALKEEITVLPMQRLLVPTGLTVDIPFGYEIQVRSRSGLALKEGIFVLNSPGTIDADYRGEIKILILNAGNNSVTIKPLDRIAQFVVASVPSAEFLLSDELSKTTRDAGGFGSTGVSN